ncbi:MAG: hypothetical protein ACXW1Y_10095 [Acidimicrobiia bacterium]
MLRFGTVGVSGGGARLSPPGAACSSTPVALFALASLPLFPLGLFAFFASHQFGLLTFFASDQICLLSFSSFPLLLPFLLIPGVFGQALALMASMGGLAFLFVAGVLGVSFLTLAIGVRLFTIHGSLIRLTSALAFANTNLAIMPAKHRRPALPATAEGRSSGDVVGHPRSDRLGH